MRILLITLLALSVTSAPANAQSIIPTLSATSQNTESSIKYHYEFKIDGVHTLADAKEVTDELRKVFNSESDPFRNYPTFIEEESLFRFDSHILVLQENLATSLEPIGYQISSFSGITLTE